jgi:hypothetical protein
MGFEQERDGMGFGDRWRAARPGCGCGRPGCEGCALTPRTVFVLQAELAWLFDLGADDIPAVAAGTRSIRQTVFAELPVAAADWATAMPGWLERFRLGVGDYVARLGTPGPVDPETLAEEVALHMAFAAARAERDPDSLLPPDVGAALPLLAGDYAWVRAEEAVPQSDQLRRLYGPGGAAVPPRGDPLHPERWFELR